MFNYINELAKFEDNLTLDMINASNYKNNNVKNSLRLKLWSKIVYTITLEKTNVYYH